MSSQKIFLAHPKCSSFSSTSTFHQEAKRGKEYQSEMMLSMLINLSQSNVALKCSRKEEKSKKSIVEHHLDITLLSRSYNFSKSMKNMFTFPYLSPPQPTRPPLKWVFFLRALHGEWIENAFHILSLYHHRHHSHSTHDLHGKTNTDTTNINSWQIFYFFCASSKCVLVCECRASSIKVGNRDKHYTRDNTDKSGDMK